MGAKASIAALFILVPCSLCSPIYRLPLNPQIRHPTSLANYTMPSTTQVSIVNSVVVTLTVPPIPNPESTHVEDAQVTVCVELVDSGASGVPSIALCSSRTRDPVTMTSNIQMDSSSTPASYPAVFPIGDISVSNTAFEPETSFATTPSSLVPETIDITSTLLKTITTTKPCPLSSSSAVSPPPIVPITVTLPNPDSSDNPAPTAVYPSETHRVSTPAIPSSSPMEMTVSFSSPSSSLLPLEISTNPPIVPEPTLSSTLTSTSPIAPKITIIPVEATPSKMDDGPITIIPVDLSSP